MRSPLLRQRSLVVAGLLALVALSPAAGVAPEAIGPSPETCPITPYSATWPDDFYTNTWHGSGDLRAGLSPGYGGRWFAAPEGAPVGNGIKVLWLRPAGEALSIEGNRLDASAPPLQAWIPDGYDHQNIQSSSLDFPTDGCWEVVARIPGQELRFVVYVHPAAENPTRLGIEAPPLGPDAWASLRRPLDLPTLATGQACSPHSSSEAGPIYPAGAARDGVLHGRNAKGWWAANPEYDGPILIRGQRIDGPEELRFPYDGTATELRLDAGASAGDPSIPHPDGTHDPGWRYWSLQTSVAAAGCYAVQIDGWNFSEVLIMPARL